MDPAQTSLLLATFSHTIVLIGSKLAAFGYTSIYTEISCAPR